MNIYVGNLPYSVKSQELREAFEAFGTVSSAEVIFDRRTKRSRGYGFVEMPDASQGKKAVESMNGSDFQGRELRVDESQPREQKESQRRERGPNQGEYRSSRAAQAESSSGGVFGFVKKLFS